MRNLGNYIELKDVNSYYEAGDKLMDNIDLNNIQRKSYENFVNNIIPYYLDDRYVLDNGNTIIEFENWYIDKSELYSEEYCREKKVSLEVALRADIKVTISNFVMSNRKMPPHSKTIPMLITKFPILTKKGSLIINGIEKILVSHLEPSNTIRLEEIENVKKKGMKELIFRTATRIKQINGNNTMNNNLTISSSKKESVGTNIKIGASPQISVLEVLRLILDDSLAIDKIVDVIGTSETLLSESFSNTINTTNYDIKSVMENFRLRLNERECLNSRLSLVRRAVDYMVARDVIDTKGNIVVRSGDILTEDTALIIQNLGLDVVVHPKSNTSIPMTIMHNKFININILYEENNLDVDDIPQCLKNKSINKVLFEKYLLESIEMKVSLGTILKLNFNSVTGKHLLKEDIIALINLYGKFLTGDEVADDIDSLSTKSIINISEIYEEYLSARFPNKASNRGSLNSENIYMDIRRSQRNYKNGLSNNTDGDYFVGLTLDTDCKKENTITSKLKQLSLFNIEDTTSPLAQANHRRKVSLQKVDNRGGTPRESSDVKPRSVNPSYAGRLDCVESSEGANIGIIRFLTAFAQINDYGIIEAPFFKVNKEEKRIEYDKVYYIGYDTEINFSRSLSPEICKSDEVRIIVKDAGVVIHDENTVVSYKQGTTEPIEGFDFFELKAKYLMQKLSGTDYEIKYHKKDWFLDENKIYCTTGHGNFGLVTYKDVDIVSVRDEHLFSAANSTIPFIQHNDATRMAMSASHGKQSIGIMGSAKPYVTTDMSKKVTITATGVITSPCNGIVDRLDATKIFITNDKGQEVVVPLVRNFQTVEKTLLYSKPVVKPGDIVLEGELLADSNMTQDGELAHSANVTVVFMPWDGFNYEDSIVINDRLVRDNILTSIHIHEHTRVLDLTKKTKTRAFTPEDKELNPTVVEIMSMYNLDNNGLVRKGHTVHPGDKIALYMEAKPAQGNRVEQFKPVSLQYREFNTGTVVESKIDIINGEKVIVIKIAHDEIIKPGDKLSGRHGNKGVISRIVPACDMPFLPDGTIADIILTPLGIPSRMNIGQLFNAQFAKKLRGYGLRAVVKTMSKLNVAGFKELMTIDGSDKVQLYDGRTGEPFFMKTTVGVMEVQKLKHQVSHKIHARSSGRYNMMGQPPQGKEANGGQKLGAMEMWSLAEMRANKVIDEILTYKTDDESSREEYKLAMGTKGAEKNNKIGKMEENSQKNTPYSQKMIDAFFKSTLNKIKYFNADNEEIDIYEDITDRDGNFNKNRIIDKAIMDRRTEVHRELAKALNNGSMQSVMSRLREMEKLIAPIEGYDLNGDDYFYGPGNIGYKKSLIEHEKVEKVENKALNSFYAKQMGNRSKQSTLSTSKPEKMYVKDPDLNESVINEDTYIHIEEEYDEDYVPFVDGSETENSSGEDGEIDTTEKVVAKEYNAIIAPSLSDENGIEEGKELTIVEFEEDGSEINNTEGIYDIEEEEEFANDDDGQYDVPVDEEYLEEKEED